MIYDTLNNLPNYLGVSDNLDTVIEYIMARDITTLPAGRTRIDGEKAVVTVSTVTPQSSDKALFQRHDAHIVLETDLEGSELFEVSLAELTPTKPTDEAADTTVGTAGTSIAGMLCEGRFALYLAGEPYKSGLKAQGCGKLNRKGLAALRELWTWRDAEAKAWDKPAFMVCSNADLIQWSLALQEQRTVTPPSRFHSHRRSRFMDALQKFYLLDEDDYPCRPRIQRRQHSDQFEANLARLCKLRDEKAEELGMEGSFLITRASLEAIAEDREKGVSTLLNWQKEALGF